jgi:hypothetical protein
MKKNSQNNEGYAVCNTCTIMLVRTSYNRAWWFRIIREPLRYGMVIMGKLYGENHSNYPVKSDECQGCVRFIKTGLKERSSLFRFLNGIVPVHGIYSSQKDPFAANTHRYFLKMGCGR